MQEHLLLEVPRVLPRQDDEGVTDGAANDPTALDIGTDAIYGTPEEGREFFDREVVGEFLDEFISDDRPQAAPRRATGVVAIGVPAEHKAVEVG